MSRLILLALAIAGLAPTWSAEVYPRGSQWRYLRGLEEASSPDGGAWRLAGFNDGSWSVGSTAIFYGEPLSGTLLEDMRGNYTSVYMRKSFTVADPRAVSELRLETLSDDGFVAWINGQEVARYNVPEGDLRHDSTALPALSEPIPWETTVVKNPADLLVAGENVIAVHGFNASLSGSSDFVFDSSLTLVADFAAPVVEKTVPVQRALVRSLRTIEVIFSEEVANVDAGDLLINGQPATHVTALNGAQYVFEFPEPEGGTVEISWAANHGIVDLSTAANAFLGEGWNYQLDPDAPQPSLIISEFMADNNKTLNDEDGDSSDWIELYNPTDDPVDLGGWFLSNDTNRPAKWAFPHVALDSKAYLLVFASEKNRTNPAARLHTNFKLPREGGFLGLYGPRTNLISGFAPAYPPQMSDVSYGRERSNPLLLGYFTAPTPGGPNAVGGPGFAPKVKFSRKGGTFANSFDLLLSTTSSNAVIHYTLGTNLPTEASPIYTAPITVSNTVQVRARAFEAGLLPGEPRSESYIQLASSLANFTSDLPVVILHNYGRGSVPSTGEQFVMMQVFEPKHGVASMTNAPDLSQRARFRLRGSSTQGIPKGSFALETWDEFGEDKKVDLLGMPEESDWVFYAPNNFEPVLIHNPFMYELSREVGRYAPRTRFVEVYLNTAGGAVQSGNYNGIYVIEEKIKRGKDRVDVDKLEPEHLNPPEVTGGYMLKIDRSDPGDYPFNAAGQDINFVDPKGTVIRAAARDPQEQYIRNYFNQFGSALNGANYRNPQTGYRQYIDVPSWIDHHILNVLAFNVDALRLSTYFYKPRNGKIEFGPIWDFDRSLGSTDGRDSNPRTWYSSGGTDFFHYPWWSRLFQDPDFYQAWIDRWENLRRNLFAQTNFNRLITELSGEVTRAQPRELAKWRYQPRGGSYQSEVNMMRNYVQSRATFIDSQFVRPPAMSLVEGVVTNGTPLTLTSSGPSIYFTLDGSDPRLPGGGLSGDATLYSGPIVIDRNARVMARTYDPTHRWGAVTPSPWSGSIAATFVVETPKLAITEIMYHPAPPVTGNYTNEDFEFIEFQNAGSSAMDLAGFRVTGGIQFEFPAGTLGAGAYIVVVKNRAVFESRYGTGVRIAGEYAGSLNNAGDHLVVQGPLLEPIADLTFKDGWHPATDGLGFSLVPANESAPVAPLSEASAWRRSGVIQGTPGRADPGIAFVPDIRINEVLTRTTAPQVDAVELYNPTGETVSLAGWFLSDNFADPKKFKFGSGAAIPARGYLVVDESTFNRGPKAFSLNAQGEEIYLFSADPAGELTGYTHGFKFDSAERGVSFGRQVTSDGREVFPPQVSLTFGAANAGPRRPPVIVSEVMFQPPAMAGADNTLDEFIELQNVSGGLVQLYEGEKPWKLRGGVDFDLPTGVTMPAGGFLLLVNFDPANAVFASGFRSRMNVPDEVPIYGPYQGKLSNSGETIKIVRPEAGDDASGGTVQITMESFDYSASAPWPGNAAGTGLSLQRLSNTFADDPVSWVAETPTPGAATAGPMITDSDGDGLPDDWESVHGLDPHDGLGVNGATGDLDGDGLTNAQEFVAGTAPNDASSVLRIGSITMDGAARLLRFEAAPGVSYSVYRRDSLDGGGWEKLADVDLSPNGGATEVRDSQASNATGYYRLVTPRQ